MYDVAFLVSSIVAVIINGILISKARTLPDSNIVQPYQTSSLRVPYSLSNNNNIQTIIVINTEQQQRPYLIPVPERDVIAQTTIVTSFDRPSSHFLLSMR